MIEHTNIIYMPNISALGGIETFVYEMVKKYQDLDIAVVSKYCDPKQAIRIKKYCRLYIHKDEQIKCNVAIINYDQSIINYIDDSAEIYQVIHADYTNSIYADKPKPHPRIKAFIAITKYLLNSMSKYLKPNNMILSYNPLTVEDNKTIVIVSATRLHKYKGLDRMQLLVNKLDESNINYVWYVITNEDKKIKGDNVIYIQNRLDISKWLNQADYVCLLSDSEACSYTLNEALYRNIPIITTPLPYLKEIGVEDGVNAYIMNFDGSNVQHIVDNITNIPKFNFKRMEDDYNHIFKKVKSKYKEELNMDVKVRCINGFFDLEFATNRVLGDEWITKKARADVLVNWHPSLVEILEPVKEVKAEVETIEDKVEDTVEKEINKVEPKKAIIPKKKIENNKR